MSKFYAITKVVLILFTLFYSRLSLAQDTLTLADDRLRLIEFFNSTNGTNWKNKTNWGNADVTTWYGVTVNNGRVTRIDLAANNLTGTIPSSFGQLTALTELWLANNSITGTIPTEFGNLTKLFAFNIDSNKLNGALPSSMGNLSSLDYLSMGGNTISGSLPAEMGNLPVVTKIYLWGNKITGSIPDAWGNMASLQILHLENNQLSGAVPATFNNLDLMTECHLQGNSLTDMPDLTGMSSVNSFLVFNNYFTFQDLIPNVGISGINYSSMKNFTFIGTGTATTGVAFSLSVDFPEAGNTIQWLKDNVAINGANSLTLSIPSPTGSDAGFYSINITNASVPGLTLHGGLDNKQGIDVVIYSQDAANDPGYNVLKTLKGSSAGFFENSPGKLATNGKVIYVHDEFSDKIQKLSTTGQLLLTIDYKSKISCLSDIEVDDADAVYLSSECDSKVVKFNSSGTFVYEITGTEQALGLAFDNSGNLLVLTKFARKIFRYDPSNSAFIDAVLLSASAGDYSLDLEVDQNGDYFLTDPGIPAIHKYSAVSYNLIAMLCGYFNWAAPVPNDPIALMKLPLLSNF